MSFQLTRFLSIAAMPALRSTFSAHPFELSRVFSLHDALCLAAASVVVVFARSRGEHFEEHTVDGAEHALVNSSAPEAAIIQEVGRSILTTRISRRFSSPK